MRARASMSARLALFAVVPLVVAFQSACDGGVDGPDPGFDLGPFKQMARTAGCADLRNQLFLIDDAQVAWLREGDCPDNAFALRLFGASVNDELCVEEDSVNGPRGGCVAEEWNALFTTIREHRHEADLGLGGSHAVEPVPF